MRFILDMGLMLLHRPVLERQIVDHSGLEVGALGYYFLYDSSPQGGMNWFMSHYDVIEGPDMVEVGFAMQGLIRLKKQRQARGQADVDVNAEGLESERQWVLKLREYIRRHYLILVGLASARASVAYEAHAFYHALYMESGSPSLMHQS